MLTPLGRTTPVCIRAWSLSDKCHYFTALMPCCTKKLFLLNQSYILCFQEFTKTAQCSSFKQDYYGNGVGLHLVVCPLHSPCVHSRKYCHVTTTSNVTWQPRSRANSKSSDSASETQKCDVHISKSHTCVSVDILLCANADSLCLRGGRSRINGTFISCDDCRKYVEVSGGHERWLSCPDIQGWGFNVDTRQCQFQSPHCYACDGRQLNSAFTLVFVAVGNSDRFVVICSYSLCTFPS